MNGKSLIVALIKNKSMTKFCVAYRLSLIPYNVTRQNHGQRHRPKHYYDSHGTSGLELSPGRFLRRDRHYISSYLVLFSG